MESEPTDRATLRILILLAACRVLLQTLVNGHYGFHRDELAVLDDARQLAWGYVAYPPVTPFIARIALDLFGPSVAGVRFFAAMAQGAAMVIGGLMARELGGGRLAQTVTAMAVAIAPLGLSAGSLFQYVSFDYLWWVAIAWLTMRLLRSRNPRWWLAIGAVAGAGMMTKYTMIFLLAGLAAGLALTPARRWLASGWLWGGAALALAICLPNLIWQAQHHFVSLDFLRSIHARDVRIGRTGGFLPDQLTTSANGLTLPLWIAGLLFYFTAVEGKPYRTIGWMYVVPLALFVAARGRGYYLAPAYPMLLAAGAVRVERWLKSSGAKWAGIVKPAAWAALGIGGAMAAAVALPAAPVNSAWWQVANRVNGDLREEIGWPEFVATVAGIRDTLPPGDREGLGILAGNYGEAGAIDLYGAEHGLPRAIAGVNSYWLRGYGNPPPRVVIVTGFSREFAQRTFESCMLAGHVTNRYGVGNEETLDHPDIFLCRGMRQPWPEFWRGFQRFG